MKKIYKLLIICFLVIVLCSCEKEKEVNNVTIHKIEEKDKNTEIKELIEKGNYIILDVRSIEEYNEQHIKGAINIEYTKIDNSTKLDKDKLIMVYCKSGKRSTLAYNTLKSLGYNVYNMGAMSDINLDKE